MRLVRSVESAGLRQSGCVLTIGNFDAVHLGHQKIIKTLQAHGKRLGLPVAVMTFDPHPEEYFLKDRSASRLTDTATRFFALQALGVDVMISLNFNQALAATTAESFVGNMLVEQLGTRLLVVGDDFRFGKDRKGDYAMLRQFAETNPGFAVEDTPTMLADSQRVSSTRIRTLLEQGDLGQAGELLGRRYNLTGRVIYGQQLGRQWGFPTLNLAVDHKPALTGVYAVRVRGLEDISDANADYGVANLGTRPTVGGLRTLLEVHLFDFDQSIYGRRICVEFIEKIRGEQKFDSFDALKEQIMRDTETAKQITLSLEEAD